MQTHSRFRLREHLDIGDSHSESKSYRPMSLVRPLEIKFLMKIETVTLIFGWFLLYFLTVFQMQ
jgi:hypothetical protein